ncbi:MAG: hypothetical protein GY874_10170 [Desulfobacteraceae bacterium]|nr:hypothetical protein [Desulfobacteraceae bacterium]
MAEETKKELKLDQKQHKMIKRCSDKEDMTEWNEWRNENQKVEIWLEGAKLQGANLNDAELQGAYLIDAKLQGAYLIDAKLQGAYLSGAKLQEAKLSFAELQGAWLNGTNLQKADLSGAKLQGAELIGAKLQGADLSGAKLQEAKLSFAELQGAWLNGTNLQEADLSGAKLQGADLSGAKLQEAKLSFAELQGAWLNRTNLQGANLWKAKLQGADLSGANLQGANLRDANLQKANLRDANLQGANLRDANLQGAKFPLAHVGGKTTISDCEFDKKTDFTGVGLDAATIDPGLKAAFKNNIRRKKWQEWVKSKQEQSKRLEPFFVKWFWLISDYGSSTKRIIGTFFGLAIGFGIVYYLFALLPFWKGVIDKLWQGNGWLGYIQSFVRAIYFSIVTMTTLGFGDMAAAENGFFASFFGNILLSIQVIIGYVLLGSLVTRLGILFTNEAPAAKPTPLEIEEDSKS